MGKHQSKLHYAWVIAFVGLSVGMTAVGFARFGYAMILPSMKEGLHLNNTQSGLLATANLIGYSLFALIGGFIVSRFGIRRLVTLSLILVSISMILTGASQTFESALFFRFLTGIGSGGSNIPRMALTAFWFSPSLSGLAMGMLLTGDGVGLAISGLIIPVIMKIYGAEGWKYSWYFLGAFSLITVALSYFFLRDKPEEINLRPLGKGSPSQKNGEKPIAGGIDATPFKSFTLYHLGLVYLAFGFTYIIYATFFTDYLVKEIGIPMDTAGWLWSIVGLTGIGSGFIWGVISDKIGRGRGLALVYLSLASSFLLLMGFRNLTGFLLSTLFFGIAAWATPAIVNAAACDYFGPRNAAPTMAFLAAVFLGTGQVIGPWIAGYIADLTGSFSSIFAVSGIILITGSIGALLLKKPKSAP